MTEWRNTGPMGGHVQNFLNNRTGGEKKKTTALKPVLAAEQEQSIAQHIDEIQGKTQMLSEVGRKPLPQSVPDHCLSTTEI